MDAPWLLSDDELADAVGLDGKLWPRHVEAAAQRVLLKWLREEGLIADNERTRALVAYFEPPPAYGLRNLLG